MAGVRTSAVNVVATATLAALVEDGRRVVLSADRPPSALAEVDAQIASTGLERWPDVVGTVEAGVKKPESSENSPAFLDASSGDPLALSWADSFFLEPAIVRPRSPFATCRSTLRSAG